MTIRRVLEQSKVYGGRYVEAEPCAWQWPEGTWLQQRRALTQAREVIKLEKAKEVENVFTNARGNNDR